VRIRFDLSEAEARRAIRRLFAAYLFISGLALAFPYRPAAWLVVALVHALAIIVLLQIGPYPIILAWLQARFRALPASWATGTRSQSFRSCIPSSHC
jgi:hypothetical protein